MIIETSINDAISYIQYSIVTDLYLLYHCRRIHSKVVKELDVYKGEKDVIIDFYF